VALFGGARISVAVGEAPRKNKRLMTVAAAVAAVVVAGGLFVVFSPRTSAAPHETTVLATFYPVYDMALNIGGNRVKIDLLVPMNVDVHKFDPAPSAVKAVADADVLIYSGAGLEPWIGTITAAAENPHLVLVDSSAGITLKDVPPQFQAENRTTDPHIWLDPILGKKQAANILTGLIRADPPDEAYFRANAANFTAKLDLLNEEAVNLTASVATRSFVTFHEAFVYFAGEYNLTQIPVSGPFEEDPTPSDIQGVIDAIHAKHLCYVGYESLENPAIPQSIASQTNATLILLDPIEGLKETDQALGKTYVIKMQDNLNAFALALNHVGCS
jgi:zinc transport system substrate-binding protein